MSTRFDCADPTQRALGFVAAEQALRRGELIVLPTDTVYGVAAEAFDPAAVETLLKARGCGRDTPPPVLVGTVRAAMALVQDMSQMGQDLIDEFWPGGLTLVCRASPTLMWDLGETKGTVAVRMPLHQVALDLLKQTGPLAVSSAKVAGGAALPTTVDEAMEQFGDAVAVYLDGGPTGGNVTSTIVDLTGTVPRLLRAGVISLPRLRQVVPLAAPELGDDGDIGGLPGEGGTRARREHARGRPREHGRELARGRLRSTLEKTPQRGRPLERRGGHPRRAWAGHPRRAWTGTSRSGAGGDVPC